MVVGGLGLGYTAQTVLENPQVRSLVVVEALPEVIEWHQRGLVPVGPVLTADPRCRLVHGDFFALAASPGLDPDDPERRFDAVVVDIDHSPRHLLHPSHAGFYAADGLAPARRAPAAGRRVHAVVQRPAGRGVRGDAARVPSPTWRRRW